MDKFDKIISTAITAVVFAVIIAAAPISETTKPEKTVKGLASYELRAYEDTSTLNTHPAMNFGTAVTFAISRDENYSYSYLKFTTPTIPAGATLDSAMLYIKLQSCSGSTTLIPHRMTRPWSENTLTWNNQPPWATPYFGSAKTVTCANNEAVLNITEIVKDWIGGANNYGLMITGQTTGYYEFSFYSSENGVSAYSPKVIVEYETGAQTNSNTSSNNQQPASQPSAQTNINTNTVSSPSKSAKLVPVESIIDEPTFMFTMRNGQQVELVGDTLEADAADKITIIGAGVPGNKVLLFVGKDIYEYTVNSLGYWGMTFPVDKLVVGKHKIEAQAQKDGKGSEKTFMLNLDRVDLLAQVDELTKDSKKMDVWDRLAVASFYLAPILSLLFWIGVILVIVLLVKRHKKKKLGELEKKEAPAVAEEQPSEPTPKKPKNTKTKKPPKKK